MQIKSALGHDVTISTCQLDFLLPRRFDLSYIDNKGEKKVPVVLHRAIFGTFDRFTAFLIEETKGAFPTWLAPVQVSVIPVNNNYHLEYCKQLTKKLKELGFRVNLDDSNEKLSYRLRNSQVKKIPLTVVIGDNEVKENQVTFRRYSFKESHTVSVNEFVQLLTDDIKNKKHYKNK